MSEVLWTPSADVRATTQLGRFTDVCERRSGRRFADYRELWEWSVGEGLEDCWSAIWDFFEVHSSEAHRSVLDRREMPGASWFGGARLNYAEHALRAADRRPDDVAVVGVSQSRARVELTWGELREQVAAARAGLQQLGVGHGDRVAAYLPNVPEAVVGLLATASLGAVWTSCAPEFGVEAVLDRFGQIEPKVLLAVDGYRYGRHDVDRTAELAAIRAGLPTLRATIVLPYLPSIKHPVAHELTWQELLDSGVDVAPFDSTFVPFDHPLYVLYSSGTTGLPKAIIHGHGGILIEHLKAIGLHGDMGPDDRFFWFTTTGWMMWNYLVSGLLVGARIVLFDGDPNHDDPGTLWRLAADEEITWFGVGAPWITACRRAGLKPGESNDLSALRAVGSTGAPLPPEDFRWIYETVSPTVLLSPISGGTDVCSAFVGGSPMTRVWAGEIPCRYLGASVRAVDEAGAELVGDQGELVITQPMPSMPLGFWNDHSGDAYRSAYFERFPGWWRHGDWITITGHGSCVISGRSDATLNRGGVRIGTAEIYRAVESIPEIADSLVVHMESDGAGAGTLVLFVRLSDGSVLTDTLVADIRRTVRSRLSPRHVPDEVYQVAALPLTLSGKKLELPVKRILGGADPDVVASRGSMKQPDALDEIVAVALIRRERSLAEPAG